MERDAMLHHYPDPVFPANSYPDAVSWMGRGCELEA
jgi:hypothetical protein